jgi:hypothetical protein
MWIGGLTEPALRGSSWEVPRSGSAAHPTFLLCRFADLQPPVSSLWPSSAGVTVLASACFRTRIVTTSRAYDEEGEVDSYGAPPPWFRCTRPDRITESGSEPAAMLNVRLPPPSQEDHPTRGEEEE